MKVKGLDGREYVWKLTGHVPLDSDERPRSKYHLRARELLARLFPSDQRLEEVPLPGCGTTLFADFVLPSRRIVVEVMGEQHFRQSSLFHETMLDFWRSQARDLRKEDWCELNEMTLIELPYDEDNAAWVERIHLAVFGC